MSTKYYKKNKEILRKRLMKAIKISMKKKKNQKASICFVSDIEIIKPTDIN